MNLIFFAVFAACACFVSGQRRYYKIPRLLDNEDHNKIEDHNETGENKSEEDQLDQKVEHYLDIQGQHTSERQHKKASTKDASQYQNRFQYWPQVVIIKPMQNHIPLGMENLLPKIPNLNIFGPQFGASKPSGVTFQTVKSPNSFSTSFSAHKTFGTFLPKTDTEIKPPPHVGQTLPTQNPTPEAREHESDDETNENEAENTESPEPELSTESPEPEPTTEPTTEAAKTEPTTEAATTEPTTEAAETEPTTTEAANTESEESTETEKESSTESSSCQTPSGGAGECVSVYNCQVLLDLVNKKGLTSQEIDLLKKSQCGYMGTAPAETNSAPKVMVCCPKQEPQGNCFTPEGKVGQCISLYSCPHLANLLKPPVPSESIAYVQKSKCEGVEQYSVCCGPPDRNQVNVGPSPNCASEVSAFPPDPRTECCGVDSRVGNKIVGGNATTVDQYPWLVIIEYTRNGQTKLLCGGVLISGRYVLTAGHCVAGQVLSIGTPKRVRLGEYDISHDGPDCAPVEAGGMDCTTGVTKIVIEKIIPHPQYNPISPTKRNDIALLRLAENAPFTDFIRPICLPTKDLTVPPNIPKNFTLYAAGWGAVSEKKAYSNVKLHVELPYVSPERCQPVYSLPGRSVPLWDAQMCAGGVTGKDSCKGDSGGPLMYEDGRTYEVIGIVSFGPVPCGMEGVPGVYSKVYEYLDWIRSTIVP